MELLPAEPMPTPEVDRVVQIVDRLSTGQPRTVLVERRRYRLTRGRPDHPKGYTAAYSSWSPEAAYAAFARNCLAAATELVAPGELLRIASWVWLWRDRTGNMHYLDAVAVRGDGAVMKRATGRGKLHAYKPQLQRLYESGATVNEMARRFGCTDTPIHRMARREGWKRP